mmetsp:Transcript_27106/g.45184  ORF Transcript_27106/g.45184 Transcript_27106/m.45184 type:complete len:229 (-) Transcript_27106:32-718(-)
MVNSSKKASPCFIHHTRRSTIKRTPQTHDRFLHSISTGTTTTTQQYLLASSDLPTQFPSGQVFEAQVNTPALSAFAVIVVVFGLLQIRTNQVNDAALSRKKALEVLRIIKSKELANEGNERSPSTEEIDRAAQDYKECIENEERLRNVVPGVIRIVAPNGPASASEEEVQAAKQFLGLDLTEGAAATKKEKSKDEDSKMSGGAVAVLAVVGLTQICLLVLLSFDPMAQ